MKKRWLVFFMVVTFFLWGCGLKKEATPTGSSSDTQQTVSISDSIADVAQALDDLNEMAGQSLDFGETPNDINFISEISTSPAFSPKAVQWNCNPPLRNGAGVHECIVNLPPKDDKEEIRMDLIVVMDETGNISKISKTSVFIEYNNGVTSVATITEYSGDVTDGDIRTGWVSVDEIKYFPDSDMRSEQINHVLLNQGTDPNRDSDNLYKEVTSKLLFKDGDWMNYSINVSPAVPDGYVGKYVYLSTTAHWEDPDVDLANYSEVTTFETDLPKGENYVPHREAAFSYIYQLKKFEFKDGTSAYEYAEKVTSVVNFKKYGRKGGYGEGTIDLESGKYSFVFYFPDESPIKEIDQNGILAKLNNNQGSFTRIVYFRNGYTRTFTAEVTLDPVKRTRTVTFERSDGWKGSFTQYKSMLEFVTTGTATNEEKQVKIDFTLEIFVDKSVRFSYKKDFLSTPQSPDEEGVLFFYPDGSMKGKAKIYGKDGKEMKKIRIRIDVNKKITVEQD